VRPHLLIEQGEHVNLRRTQLVPKWGYRALWMNERRLRRKLELTVKALLELVEDEEDSNE
jgi:hypothetical protein